ncbi:MAG TPA: hypothetical protein VF516_37075 [Kofleriaceae bacterium]
MHKTLLSVSLWMLPTGCAALFGLKDVQIVDGGSGHSTDGMADSATTDGAMTDSAMMDGAMMDSAMMDSAMTDRMYHCGYAAPGKCDNRRRSQPLIAPDMTAAIAACKKQKPKPDLDFCYVKDDDGMAATDESQCMAASGSWRPDRNCCAFMGTPSCSASP